MSKPPSIQITIENSSVGGDVVAGHKISVHIHENDLKSAESILSALRRQGLEGSEADELIAELAANQDFTVKFDSARKRHDAAQVDVAVSAAVAEIERLGPTADVVKRLTEALEKCRKNSDWVSFCTAGAVFLQAIEHDLEHQALGLAISNDLLKAASTDPSLYRTIPIARIYQAKHLFFKYSSQVIQLRTDLQVHSTIQGFPLVNLLKEQKEILGYHKLSDTCAKKALEAALNSGDVDLAINTLMGLTFIQEHGFFLQKNVFGQDASELAERVLRSYQLIEKLARQFGKKKELAILNSNVANFFLQLCEFEKAEAIAMQAAAELSSMGLSAYASRAIEIATAAKKKEQIVPPPPPPGDNADHISTDDLVRMIRELSERQLHLQGIDLESDPSLKRTVESGWKDITPERVLKFCEHISVDYQTSPLGEKIMLPTHGRKRVYCNKFDLGFEGMDLDTAHMLLRNDRCNTCTERKPRPDSWHWSLKWDREERERRKGVQ